MGESAIMNLNRFDLMVAGTVLVCVLALSPAANANTIAVDADGGATLIIDNTATNAQTLLVGTDNNNNSLIITNAGSLTVETAAIGSTDFGGDSVLVTGSNSYLQTRSRLNVGTASGSFGNKLTLTDDGWVFVGDLKDNLPSGSGISVGSTNAVAALYIGSGSQIAADSLMVGTQSNAPGLVSLSGSAATLSLSGDLQLGTASSDNSISIANGAALAVGNDLLIGSANTMNNELTINNASSAVILGSTTINNGSLSIGSGSQVETASLMVGTQSNAPGSVSLSGNAASLSLSGDLQLGTASSDSMISVANGATITVGNDLLIGSANTINNELTINNGGSAVILGTVSVNNTPLNSINVNNGGSLAMPQGLNLDDDNDGFNISAGALLELGGTVLADKMDYNLDVTISGAGTTWITTNRNAYVGDAVNGNSLTVKGGASIATAADERLYVGNDSDYNILVISGTNSTLTAGGDTFIGSKGSYNTLTIEESADALMQGTFKIGNITAASDNAVNVINNGMLVADNDIIIGVKGKNSSFNVQQGHVWVGGDLILGSEGINNRYTQTGGTNTVAGEVVIGQTAESTGRTGFVDDDRVETTGNLAIVGEDASLNIGKQLTVGMEGGGSILTIRDGGIVKVADDAVIGEAVGDNYIYLQRDGDTRFDVTGDLVVGKSEKGSNRFAIYGGTAGIGGSLYLGAVTNQHDIKNYIHLETTNAVLNVVNAVHVGAASSLNTLDIVDGAVATANDFLVGTFHGTSNNVVTVTGDGSLLSVANTLGIGSATGADNAVVVENGGVVSVEQSNIALSGTDNVLQIADGGTLKAGDWDFNAITGGVTNILFDSGSTLHLRGTLSGTNEVAGGVRFMLDGNNALWDTGNNVLVVGNADSRNALTLTNGAHVTTLTDLYIGKASHNNTVTVGGAGSHLEVGGSLFIGDKANTDAYYNTLAVLDGGLVDVGGNLRNDQGGTLRISSDSGVRVAGDYEQTFNLEFNEGTTLQLGVSTNQFAPNLMVVGTANFTTGSTIFVYNDGIGEYDTNVVRNVVVADQLTIDDTPATTGLLMERITIQTNLLLGFDVSVSNGNTLVVDNFIVHTLGEAAGLEGQLLAVANEIESLSSSNAMTMLDILSEMDAETVQETLDNYYGEKMSSTPAHNVINLGVHNVAGQLTQRADSTRVRMGAASAAINWNKPTGVAGPHMQDQKLQGWLAGYGTWLDKSEADGFDGYDGNISGFLIGADLSVADGILFGFAGGSGFSALDKNNGASIDTKTTYATLYASVGTEDWFADGSFIYGVSSVDARMDSVFDTKADYDADNVAVYIGGGKEIVGDYLIITPQASLLGNYYNQESYDEESSTAVPRSVASFDTFYLQSRLGCNVGVYIAMDEIFIRPELSAFWLHEFNAQEEDLVYTLAGGSGSYIMQLQAPEEDLFKIGAGASAKLGEYLEVRVDIDGRYASDYSDYTLLGTIRYRF
jgi:T5SS/PEP-CTERM-associated repeat protein